MRIFFDVLQHKDSRLSKNKDLSVDNMTDSKSLAAELKKKVDEVSVDFFRMQYNQLLNLPENGLSVFLYMHVRIQFE